MNYQGLSIKEVQELQRQYGVNVLPAEKYDSAFKIFLSQFTNPLIYIILLAGFISLFLREYQDVIIILAVVILNAFFGYWQEHKTQKTLMALKNILKPRAKVVRDGKRQEIDASDLSPGDIVFLTTGDKAPADGEIIEVASLLVNEAILTGESEGIVKKEKDEIYMGTIISWGRAVVKITKIGRETKIGKIAETLKKTVQPPTTLQLHIKNVSHFLIKTSAVICIIVFFVGLLSGRNFWEIFRIATVLAVAMIPEALLIAVTMILVISMQKTLKRNALIKKLSAVETLGSVSIICTDKTGTLTEGKMRVVETDFKNKDGSFFAINLCNDLSDSLEVALWNYLENQPNYYPQENFDKYKRSFEIPFGSEYKFMVTVNTLMDGDYLFIKGAPEIILKMSDLPQEEINEILQKIEKWGKNGLKILGLARQKITNNNKIEKFDINNLPVLEWLGIVGLWDPPREEVKEALFATQKAGIKIKVITGDYRQTAEKIMSFLNIAPLVDEVMEGSELEKINDEDLQKKIMGIVLFTRITPHQKLRIVNILQKMGEVVAMTGDGVNDAPALKRANIGLVVGDASEVAKETADIILLDSNFKTIVSAIEEGRLVFENIKKSVLFMLSNSFTEVVLIFISIILGWPLPLTIIQILWLHLLCDGPEDIVLAFEPKEKELMREGPKKITESIIGNSGLILIFLISLLSGIFALILFWYYGIKQGDLALGRTMAFIAISFGSILFIFSFRSLRKPFWKYENFWSNKWLFITIIFSLFLQITILYLPFTQNILGLVPLNIGEWSRILLVSIIMVLFIELLKSRILVDHRRIL